MKRILLIGAYAGKYAKVGGEIAKVRALYNYYSAFHKVILFDTYWEKKNIFQYIYKRFLEKVPSYIRLMIEIERCDIILICRSDAKFEKIVNKRKALNKTSAFGIGNLVPKRLLESCNDISFWNLLNGIFVESEEMVKELELKGVKTACYVPNFKELPRYKSTKYEGNKEIIELFYHGIISEYKGIDCLIEAVNRINRDKMRCRLFLYGDCEKDYDLKSKLNQYIFYSGKLNLMDSVDDYEILRHHDVFVFPTKWKAEGISGSLQDALALGKPVLATCHNLNHKMVRNGENGYLFEKDDVAALMRLIIKLYDNQELIYEMGNRSLIFAEDFRVENVLGGLKL